MARRNRRSARSGSPLSRGTTRSTDEHADGVWVVSTWPARSGGASYTCPVCGRELAASTSHLVVWPHAGGVDDRRHVHTTCWRRRASQPNPVRW